MTKSLINRERTSQWGAESWEREKSEKSNKNCIYPIVTNQEKREPFPSSFQNFFFPVTLKWPFYFLIFPEKEAEEKGRWSRVKRVPSDFLINNASNRSLFFLRLFFLPNLKFNYFCYMFSTYTIAVRFWFRKLGLRKSELWYVTIFY